MWGRTWVLLMVACCAAAPAAGLQRPQRPTREGLPSGVTYSIMGRVLFAQGFKGARGIRVRLLGADGIPRTDTFSRDDGRFNFTNLPGDRFIVEASEEGFRVARQEVDFTFYASQGHSAEVTVTLMLERETTVEVKPSTDPVSVRELKVPDKARKEFEKGVRELQEKKRPEKSLEHFRRAIEIFPDYDEAYVQLGLAHLDLQQGQEAQTVLEKAVQANAENGRAHTLLGIALKLQGQNEKAIQPFQEAVRLEPEGWIQRFELADSLFRLQRYEESFRHCQEAHRMDPKKPRVHVLMYNLAMRRNDTKTALEELEEFLSLFPDHRIAPQVRQAREKLLAASPSVKQNQ